MVSTSFMVDTSSHPRAQLHRCVEKSAFEENTELAVDASAYFGGKTTPSAVEATRKWPLMHSPSAGVSTSEIRLPVGCPHRSAQEKAGGRADSREGLTAARRPAP